MQTNFVIYFTSLIFFFGGNLRVGKRKHRLKLTKTERIAAEDWKGKGGKSIKSQVTWANIAFLPIESFILLFFLSRFCEPKVHRGRGKGLGWAFITYTHLTQDHRCHDAMNTCHRANRREISSDCEPNQLALPTRPPLALPVHWMIAYLLGYRWGVLLAPRPLFVMRYHIKSFEMKLVFTLFSRVQKCAVSRTKNTWLQWSGDGGGSG